MLCCHRGSDCPQLIEWCYLNPVLSPASGIGTVARCQQWSEGIVMSGHHTVPPPWSPVSFGSAVVTTPCHISRLRTRHVSEVSWCCTIFWRRCQLTGSVLILKVKYNIKALYKEKTLVYMSAPITLLPGVAAAVPRWWCLMGLVIAQIISVQCLSLFPSRPGAVRGRGRHGTGTFVAMNTEHIVTSGILVEADPAKHDS